MVIECVRRWEKVQLPLPFGVWTRSLRIVTHYACHFLNGARLVCALRVSCREAEVFGNAGAEFPCLIYIQKRTLQI